MLWSATLTVTAQVVNIPDPGLKAAVRQALGKPAGDLTVADMEHLQQLLAQSRLIRSAEGLEAARNLAYLDLSYNYLTDLTLSAELSKLTTLSVWGNQLTNLTLPVGLSNLTVLTLGDNRLTALSLPVGPTRLTGLAGEVRR
jgi:internalin A